MQRKYITLSVLILVMLLLLGSGGYAVVQLIANYSPAKQVTNAWELAKLSGSYSFRSEVDQRTAPAPQMGNYGQPAKHLRMRIEGNADEANQTAEVVITNITAEGESSTHIRRARGHTYVMQADGTWRESNASAVASQLSGLTYLAGIRDVTRNQGNQYAFGFDGQAFATHLTRLLDADMAHGVTYDAQTYQAAQSEQLIASTGNGQLSVDQDGLPATISLDLELPATAKDRAANVAIKTVFFDYARTGLALQSAMHQPLHILSKYIGTDAKTVRDWLLISGSLGVLLLLVVLLQLFGRRMYLPVTMVVVAMIIYQPYSTIPRTQAATADTPNDPTPVAGPSTGARPAPPKVFNPLIAPLDQPMGIALPVASVTSPSNMRVVASNKNRSVEPGTNTDCSAIVAADKTADTDTDGLSNAIECSYGTTLTSADSDSDGLTDLEEIRLGTSPTVADTDSDGLSDFVEVTYYTQYSGSNQKYYTSPFAADTNGDGINDTLECIAKLGANSISSKDTPIATLQTPCVDSNGDGVPDFLSFDNDGDSVPDNVDSLPNDITTTTWTDTVPYALNIGGMTAPTNRSLPVKPVMVEMQIVPTHPNLLYANNAIYDWPSGDTKGQIQRTQNTTFATTTSTDIVTPTGSLNPMRDNVDAQHGDMKIVGFMEVKIDVDPANGDYGNLPVMQCAWKSSVNDSSACSSKNVVLPCDLTANCDATITDAVRDDTRPRWLDTSKLTPYSISGGWSRNPDGTVNKTQLTLNIPLTPITDDSGSMVAYKAMMYYHNNQIWRTAHKYRLQWLVTSLQNICPATGTCTDANRTEHVRVVHSYYDDWKLTGISATEEHGMQSAIITERTTQYPAVQDVNKRHLVLAQVSRVLQAYFVNNKVLSIDQITTLFHGSNPNNFGIDNSALWTSPVDYWPNAPMPLELMGQSSNSVNTQYQTLQMLPLMNYALNDITCSARLMMLEPDACSLYYHNGIQRNRVNPSFASNCQNNMRIACRPGMIIVSETRLRTLDLSNGSLTLFPLTPITSVRTFKGQVYQPKINTDGQAEWQPLNDQALQNEILDVGAPLPTVSPESSLSVLQWQPYYSLLKQIVLFNFFDVHTKIYADDSEPTTVTIPTAPPTANSDTWDVEIANYWQAWGSAILALTAQNNQPDTNSTDAQKKLMVNAINKIQNMSSESVVTPSNAFNQVMRNSVSELVILFVMVRNSQYRVQPKSNTVLGGVFTGVAVVSTVLAILAIKDLYSFVKGAQDVVMIVRAANAAISLGNVSATIDNVARLSWFYSNVSAKLATAFVVLGIIGAVIGIGVTWYTASTELKNANYAFQKVSIVASAIGKTFAIVILLVLSLIPPIGTVIAAIAGALDAVAAATCYFLSTRQQRSAAGKWLCGGVTGLLGNVLSFTKISVIVDTDDMYSHNRTYSDSSNITIPLHGFQQGNAYNYNLAITDHIEKMPFPAAWQSVFFPWQWTMDEYSDIKTTSYRYALGPTNIDLRGTFDVGSDFNNWVSDTGTYTNTSDTTDTEQYTYTYKKTAAVNNTYTFDTTGINQTHADLYLSSAYKVRQQVCFSIPILILFIPYLIPVCYMRTHDDNPAAVSVYSGDMVTFDTFPDSMNGFMTMKPGSAPGHYTFGWNTPVSATDLAFPDFVDADHDGLTADLEIVHSSNDNDPDSDNDGISDNQEVVSGTNPTLADSDSDGLTDLQEVQYGTDPNKSDTDGDGLRDGEEIVRSVNGQRIGGWDVTYGFAVDGTPKIAWLGADPLNPDSDSDGIIDLRERILGTSPYAKNSPDVVGFENITVNEATQPSALLNFAGPTGNRTITTTDGAKSLPVNCSADVPVTAKAPNSSVSTNGLANLSQNYADLFANFSGDAILKNCVITNTQITPKFTVSMWANLNCDAIIRCTQGSSDFYFFKSKNINIMTTCPGSSCYGTASPNLPNTLTVSTHPSSINGIWTHIALVYDGEFYIYYQNGIELIRWRGVADQNFGDMTLQSKGFSFQVTDFAFFGSALTPSEIMRAKSGELYQEHKSDLVVRPGDQIHVDTTIKNKLLGRELRGNAFYSVQSDRNVVPSSDARAFAVARNGTSAFVADLMVPGTTVSGTATTATQYSQKCRFGGNLVCLTLDEPNTASVNKTFADISPNSAVVSCDGSNPASTACPVFDTNAWYFSNDNPTSLQLPASIVQQMSNHDFSVGMWVNLKATNVSARPFLSIAGLRLGTMGANIPMFGPNFTDSSAILQATSSSLEKDTWYHLIYRFQNNRRFIYVNGDEVAYDVNPIAPMSFDATNKLLLGSDGTNSPGAFIRDVQIYNQALSDGQIRAWGRNCDDPMLVTCVNPASDSADASEFGAEQLIGLSTTAGKRNFTDGTVNLYNNRDFTLIGKFATPSVCVPKWLFQATANAGQAFRLSLDGACRLVTEYAKFTETSDIQLTPSTNYVVGITNRVNQEVRIAIYHAASPAPIETVTHAVNLAGTTDETQALTQVIDPVFVPTNGLSHLRVYGAAISDATVANVAQYVLSGKPLSDIRQPPQSDTLTVRSEARAKVIQDDPNFERDPNGATPFWQLAFDEPALATTFQDVISTTKQFRCVIATCPQSGMPGVTGNGLVFTPSQFVTSSDTMLDPSDKALTLDFWIKPAMYGGLLVKNNRYEVGLNSAGHITVRHAYQETGFTNVTYRWPTTLLESQVIIPLGRWSRVTINLSATRNVGLDERINVNGTGEVRRSSADYTSITQAYNAATTLGFGYAGAIDNLTISNDSAGAQVDANRPFTLAPAWKLSFEDYLATTSVMTDTDGVTKAVTLGSLIVPDNTIARTGIARYKNAATCVGVANLNWATCPMVDVIGLAGLATTFTGPITDSNSLLEVRDAKTVMDSIKNGGTVQLIINPQNKASIGTVLAYGNWNDDTSNGNGLKVVVGNDLKVTVSIGAKSYTVGTALVPTWNVISFDFGTSGFHYYQNGNKETNFTGTDTSLNATFTTDASWRLFIGGNPSAGHATAATSALFKGGIDDIAFFPGVLPSYLMYQSARMQSALGMVKKELATLTLDADNPSATVTAPNFVSGDGAQYLVETSDATSLIDSLEVRTTKQFPTLGSTASVMAPVCAEQTSNDNKQVNYCPFFTGGTEGLYDVQVIAKDAVYNRGINSNRVVDQQNGLVYVDTTPPNLQLVPAPSGNIYTTTVAPGAIFQTLTLKIKAGDPVLANSDNHRGSGVQSLEVNLQNLNGQSLGGWVPATLIPSSVITTATVITGTWVAQFRVPMIPNGFYQVQSRSTDNVGNTRGYVTTPANAPLIYPYYLANTNSPIQIDSAPPRDVIVDPSPRDATLGMLGPSTLANSTLRGRVSDYYDGRGLLQADLQVKLDFETADGAKAFDNRAYTRVVTDCTNCPTVAADTLTTQDPSNLRVARFNIDGNQQYIASHDTGTLFNTIFSVGMQVKISDSGTLLSNGNANNPRLRIFAARTTDPNKFKITAFHGNVSVSTPGTLTKNTWYGIVYNETPTEMRLQWGGADYLNWPSASIITKSLNLSTIVTPATSSETLIGATQSSTNTALVEDYFRGYLDNVIISAGYLDPSDFAGRSVAPGSNPASHQTRLKIRDDGFADADGLASLAKFYMPFNQSTLAALDVMNAQRSDICNGGFTTLYQALKVRCPMIGDGFTSNAIWLDAADTGVRLGYAITQTAATSQTYSMRVRIAPTATSGRVATIGADSAALGLRVDYDQRTQQLTTTLRGNNGTTAVVPREIIDNQWHLLTAVIAAGSSATTAQVYWDSSLITSTAALPGLFTNAGLSLGALPGSGAATGIAIDDVGVFNRALTEAQLRVLAFGSTPVYHETFDGMTNGTTGVMNDESLFQLPTSYTNVKIGAGTVGDGLLASTVSQTVSHRDDRGLTVVNPNEAWALSLWVTPKNTSATGTILTSSTPDGYGYTLGQDGTHLKFTHAGTTMTGSAAVTAGSATHVVVNSDGTTMTMYMNGTSVASAAVSSTLRNTPLAKDLTLTATAVVTTTNIVTDSTLWDSNAANADDGDPTTVFTSTVQDNPWWLADLGSNQLIDRIIVRNRNDGSPTNLRNLHVLVSDDPSINFTNRAAATWSDYIVSPVAAFVVLTLPYGTRGRYVRLQIEGRASQLALSEVQIQRTPLLTLSSVVAAVDDVRVYRHALNADTRNMLGVMAWQPSTIDTTNPNSIAWTHPLPSGLEVDADIQSTTTDALGNTRTNNVGEQSLWHGLIDTYAPRITDNISATVDNTYTYTVQIDEHNPNLSLLQTPCGVRLNGTMSLPNSLGYRVQSSGFDGSVIPQTHFDGDCVLSNTPDVVQRLTQVISSTTSMVFGDRYAYVGGVNMVNVVDVQNATNLIQNNASVPGTVTQLLVSRNKNRLYVVSTQPAPTPRATLTVFDIASNGTALQQRGSVVIPLGTNVTVTNSALTDEPNGNSFTDRYLLLLTNTTPQKLISVLVENPDQPTQVTTTALNIPGYDIAASYDVVAIAQGTAGIRIYRVNADGSMTFGSVINVDGYSNRVLIDDKKLFAIVDDESAVDANSTPNKLIVAPLITTVVSDMAVLQNPLLITGEYVHVVPTDHDDVAPYRITDIAPYIGDDVVLLSKDVSNLANVRLSMVSTAGITPTLRSDTAVVQANMLRVVAQNNNILTLANSAPNAQLRAFVASDRRFVTRLCDAAGNCSSGTDYHQDPFPAANNVSIVNLANAYKTSTTNTTVRFGLHAEAPLGVRTIQTQIDNNLGVVAWTNPDQTSILPAIETSQPPGVLSQGSHTIRAINTYNNTLSAVAEYYAPMNSLPLVDVMHPNVTSRACTPNCPAISNNTLVFTQTNTIDINNDITQVAGTAKLLSMKLKIPALAPSGRIVSLQPVVLNALTFWVDYDESTHQIVATVRDTITTTARFAWPDDQFHQLTVVANAMNNATTFNLYVDGVQQEALSASIGSRFTAAKVIFGANGVNTAPPTGMVLDDVALLSSPVTVDETLDYRTAVSETAFPLIDEIFDKRSSCSNCPTIATGTLTFPRSSDGLNLGYTLTQTVSTAISVTMKFKVDGATTSGRIATLQSKNASALKLRLDYDQSNNRVTATAMANGTSQSVYTTTLVADTWATLSVLAETSALTTTFVLALDGKIVGTIAMPGRFTNAALSLGAVSGAVAATGMTIDDIEVANPAIANNETVAVNQITALMSGDVITPYTVKTPIYSFFVDNVIPQITLVDDVIGRMRMVDGMVSARITISDMSNLTDLQIINTDTNTRIPLSMSRLNANTTAVKVFYPEALLNQNLQTLSLKITTTDSAQNSTVQIKTIDVDNDAPVLVGGVMRAKVNGTVTALGASSTVTRTSDLDLHVKWTNITDRKAISLRQLEYTYQTISDTISVNQTITNPSGLRTSTMIVPEGSRVDAGIRLRDAIDNEDLVSLPPVYVDSAVTPDYTQISKNPNDIYRGWAGPAGCALNASANSGAQKFFATWDNAALRLNWQGTDWDNEGDLFVYLDTAAGGTLQPYRPSKYVHSDGVTNGDAFVTLPMDMAGRVTSVSSVTGMLNQWQTRLRDVLRGTRTIAVAEGADYVIHVSSAKSMEILHWQNSAWVPVSAVPDYTFSMLTGTAQTDIRVPFGTIGYTVGNPFGMVAFASKADYLLPWVTFPTTNPTVTTLSSNKITLTPLINGYRWASLAGGVCPRSSVRNPDTTQIQASLSSTPNGVTQRAVADVFTNTNPDALASAIDQTSAMCSQLPNDPWCVTVAQLQDTATAGAALMSALGNTLVTQQAPVIGKNSTVSYNLTVTNPSNRPSKALYAIVQTYGGIWLTGSINATTSNGVYDGGLYSYHTVTTPGYKDFQVVKIASIPANGTRTIALAAKIDPIKAQSSGFDRINTSTVAKIDVRVVDTAAVTTTGSLEWLSTGRTIEWLNAGLRIDTQAPSQIKPDTQLVVGTGAVRVMGSVSDDSAVPSVALEYTSSVNAVVQAVNCGAAVAGRWSCAVTVPSTATSISYRVRAADAYGQMSPWSAWYRSVVDRDNPTLVFDANSTSALSAAYVGGSSISISGLITDSTTTAAIQFCDDQQANCRAVTPSGGSIAVTATYTTTVSSPSTAIAAQPCNATSFDDYTVYPITVTNVANGRVDSVTVSATIAHAAAQEVDLWVQSPSGTRVPLLTTPRGAANNLRVTFADDATSATTTLLGATGLSDAYDRVRPDGSLTLLSGEAGSGTWKLLACDRNTNATTGSIDNAQLVIKTSGAARHQGAAWSTVLANTTAQDGVARRVRFWAVDSVGNVSASRSAVLTIDTVAPSLNVTQNDTVIFPGGSSNAFQGSISDGGTLDTLQAVISSASNGSTVATYTLTPVAMTSMDIQRLNYLQQRSLKNYTWGLTPAQLSGLATGRYTVQFVVRDVVGNQRTSAGYAFTIPTKAAPTLNDINVTGSTVANVQTFNTRVDTGFANTTIDAQIALDSNTSTYTDTTTVHGWAYNGSVDSTLQGAIPSAVQSAKITKLEMNNDFAAFLDQDGKLRTWPVDGRADHLSTSNQIAGTTPITNVVQFSIADQLTWDNYLLTLDNNGAVREYRQPDGNSTVTTASVTIKNRSGQVETSKVIAIDAGYRHTVLLLRSGQVITCSNLTAICQDTATTSTAAYGYTPAPARYGVTQVQAGIDFSVALRSDGKVVAWGDPSFNHLVIPSNIKPVTQIATGGDHTLALQNDGTVVAWGDNSSGQATVPVGLTNVVYIAAGANSSAAVTQSGQVVVWGESNFTTATTACCASAIALNYEYPDPNNSSSTIYAQVITAHQTGSQSRSMVVPAAAAMQPTQIVFRGLIPGRRYTYTLTVRNSENSNSPQVYQGTFTNNLAFNRTYLPYLANASPAVPPVSSGR